MISVCDYVKNILEKKKMTLQQFADEINKVKLEAGINTKTSKQNISNFLHNTKKHELGIKQLVIWEKALNLPKNSLTKMVGYPKTRKGRNELEELQRKVWKC